MLAQWLLGCHTGETPCKLGANCGIAPQMSAQDFENNLEEVHAPRKDVDGFPFGIQALGSIQSHFKEEEKGFVKGLWG